MVDCGQLTKYIKPCLLRFNFCTYILCILRQVIAGLKTEDKTKYPQWIQDFRLVAWGHQGLFYEYLEMGKD